MGMRPKLFAIVAVSAFALVGCSAGETSSELNASASPSPATEADVKAKALSIESTPTDSVAVDPLEAQKRKTYEEQTADFRAFINPEFSGWAGELPPESDLLAAAKLVCEQLRSGTPYNEVEAIKGSLSENSGEGQSLISANNQKLVNAASSAFCLEERSKVSQ